MSATRRALLLYIGVDAQPVTRHAIERYGCGVLPVHAATVQRELRRMVQAGVVAVEDGRYKVTNR